MKIFKRIHMAENATLTEIGLLLHIAQNTTSGLYQFTDNDTADATNSTKPTVQRLRNRLTMNGYLREKIPAVWCGKDGWSTVGVEVTLKGLKKILLNTKLSQASNPDSKNVDPDDRTDLLYQVEC